jgi:hypothetical protein
MKAHKDHRRIKGVWEKATKTNEENNLNIIQKKEEEKAYCKILFMCCSYKIKKIILRGQEKPTSSNNSNKCDMLS